MDLLIVDDDNAILEISNRFALHHGLETIVFLSGVEALAWLNSSESYPAAYLIDMKPGETIEELDSPFNIFEFVKRRNYEHIKNFRFYTGHYSGHDEYVCRVTGAKVIIKPGIDELCQFFRILEEQKRNKYVAEAQ